MKNNQKFAVSFWINLSRAKNGEAPIYTRIYLDSKRVEVATRLYVQPKYWNAKGMDVKPLHPDHHHYNTTLSIIKSEITRHFLLLASGGELVDINLIKNKYLGIDEKPKHKTICEAFDYHNLKMKETAKVKLVSPKTLLRYEITKNKVVEFMKDQFALVDRPLPELRLGFVTEFEHFLLTKHKLQSNTAHKYIKNLKKVMNMAVGLDWIPSNPFNQFKCSYSNPEREILTSEELNTVINKEIKTPRLAEVRDVFIFCCYTGFAYTDVYKFEKDAVLRGIDGEFWLSTNRQKTGTKESVPLLEIPLQIIEKYKTHPYCEMYNKLLPINSNQRYNAYLKELAEICGIKKHLTTHTARHTFATTVTLANGVPIETVSSMLGHNNIRTTQIYAKVVEQKVSDDMKLLREKLKPQPAAAMVKTGS
jgi:site-specific recombinase XerD